jgi:hypothetical protein
LLKELVGLKSDKLLAERLQSSILGLYSNPFLSLDYVPHIG